MSLYPFWDAYRLDCFVATFLAMTCKHVCIINNVGTPTPYRDGRVRLADMRGSASKGLAKGLTLTERRLSFDFAEVTPRPEGQVLRRPWGGLMMSALIFSVHFASRQKGQKRERVE